MTSNPFREIVEDKCGHINQIFDLVNERDALRAEVKRLQEENQQLRDQLERKERLRAALDQCFDGVDCDCPVHQAALA